jgi:hypothetical protein
MTAADQPGHGDDQRWSAQVAGLRGRLVADAAASSEPFAIDLELENTSAQPLQVTLGDPLALTASLVNAGGQEVPTAGARIDIISQPKTVELAPHSRTRHPITARHEDATASIDLTTAFWKLAPGHYRLSAHWTSHAPGGWSGELVLLPLDLEQR